MSRDFLYGMAFMFGCYCAIHMLAYLIGRALAIRHAVERHDVTRLPSPGPPAHWPGCEKEGCNCWTCGKHYLCPKGSHRT
jgi:hypothetical protein